MRALFLALVALGAFLRAYGLNRESLWNDELSTMARLDPGPWSEVFWTRIAADVHPPGYLLFMSAWTSLFGNGELALRSPSALAGVALIAAVHAFGARYFGPVAGLLAAAFCAVSPLHIRYSQEARSFALVTFTTFLAAWALTELLQHPAPKERSLVADLRLHWRSLTALVLSAVISAYLSYVGFIAVAVLFAFGWATILLTARDRARRLLMATLLSLGCYLPWVHGLLQHLERGGLTWLDPPQLSDLYRAFSLALPLYAWALLGGSIALATAWRAAAKASRESSDTPGAGALGLWLAGWMAFGLPILFYVKSIVSTPIYNDRNLLVVVPFFALLAAVALARTVPTRGALAAGLLIVTVVLVHFTWIDRFYTSPIKQDFRGAARHASAWLRNHSANAVVCLAWNKRYFSYYLRQDGIATEPTCSSRSEGALSKLYTASGGDKPGKRSKAGKLGKAGKRSKGGKAGRAGQLGKGAAPVAFVYGHIRPSSAFWRQVRKDFVIVERHDLHKAGAALLRPR